MEKTTYKRLESLDALRGFDLFFLVALGPLAHSLARAADAGWLNEGMWAFSHVRWEGFSPWDLIMPPVSFHVRGFNAFRLIALQRCFRQESAFPAVEQTYPAALDIRHDVPGQSAGA